MGKAHSCRRLRKAISVAILVLLASSAQAKDQPSEILQAVDRLNTVSSQLGAKDSCTPQITVPKVEIPRDLLQGIDLFKTMIRGGSFSRKTCAPVLHQIYERLFRVSPAEFDQMSASEHATEIVRGVFEARLEMRKQLGRMEAQGPVSSECVSAIRDILRAALFMQEYVAEKYLQPKESGVFEGGEPSLLVNPEFGNKLQLKSGDLLLSRGDAFVSGAIARIGDTDGNFSHAALVYIDPKDGKSYTIEAHIEKGTVLRPLEEYLKDGKSRSIVFRQKDSELGKRAAQAMVDRVRSTKKNIPYDFGMMLEGETPKGADVYGGLSCTKVARQAYKLGSDGNFMVPRYPTGVHMKNENFLKSIGFKAHETFAPSDLEVDSRFDEVAEWRNFGKTEKSRMTDAVLTRVYDMMEKRGYLLEGTNATAMLSGVAYVVRHTPLLKRTLEEKFPENMPRSTINAMMALDATAKPMLNALTQANEERKRATGFAMTANEMAGFLDQFAGKDYQAYLARQKYEQDAELHQNDDAWHPPQPIPPKSAFHSDFHPIVK